MFGVFLDGTERKRARKTMTVLGEQISHRVKNLFAIAAASTVTPSR